ncbi:WD40-repeat-containing domain protein [Syncephalis fuscata]|nr:WD40-repeat-containing domain protein [Syncephalis fuscata]
MSHPTDAQFDEGYDDGTRSLADVPITQEVRIEQLLDSISDWTDGQKAKLALQILGMLPTQFVAHIVEEIQPWLYHDFITDLPSELSFHILSFLDAQTLGRVSQVSRQWKRAVSSNLLWRKLYENNGWSMNHNLIEWYNAYGERMYQEQLANQGTMTIHCIEEICDIEESPSKQDIYSTPPHQIAVSKDKITIPKYKITLPENKVITSKSDMTTPKSRIASTSVLLSSTSQLERTHLPNNNINAATGSMAVMDRRAYQALRKQPSKIINSSETILNALVGSLAVVSSVGVMEDPTMTTSMDQLITVRDNAEVSYIDAMDTSDGDKDATTQLDENSNNEQALIEVPRRLRCIVPNAVLLVPGHYTVDYRPCVNWRTLYRTRCGIERRWRTSIYMTRYLPGHAEGIYCVQFDEDKIISGSRDNTIRLWDMATSACVQTLTGHTASVLCLQYDKQILVSGGSDAIAIIWNMKTGQRIHTLTGHTDSVLNLCFDHRFIVTCSKDRTIRVWARNNYRLIHMLEGHRVAVNGIALRNDLLVSVSGDRTFRVWDIHTGACLRVVSGHTRGIACVQFDGQRVFTGSSDRSIRIWDVKTGECLGILQGHGDLVRSLDYDGRWLISGSYDHTIRIWDPDTQRVIAVLRNGHDNR